MLNRKVVIKKKESSKYITMLKKKKTCFGVFLDIEEIRGDGNENRFERERRNRN